MDSSARASEPVADGGIIPVYASPPDSTASMPRVAGAADEYVVVWSEGAYPDVRLQEVAGGATVGAIVEVNSYTSGSQDRADVGRLSDGSFVVLWNGDESDSADPDVSIQGRLFGADGTPQGDDFLVNDHTPNSQYYAKVAVSPVDDSFVVTWQSSSSAGSDNDGYSIQARRFAADGTPLAAQFQVNEYTTGEQGLPHVAVDEDGKFVVTWVSYGSDGSDQTLGSIQARLFLPDAAPAGAQFQVNTFTQANETTPRAAFGPDGKFMVVFNGADPSGVATEAFDVVARCFDASGTALGADFVVEEMTTGSQKLPELIGSRWGRFVVAWSSYPFVPGTDVDLRLRVFDAGCQPESPEIEAAPPTTSARFEPTIAGDAARDFMVVWRSAEPGFEGVRAQRYTFGVFGDGFESASTASWSAVVP